MARKGSAPFNWDPALQPLGPVPRERRIRVRNSATFRPYVRRELDDDRCAREAAAKLAAIRAKLPPEWHAWHAARRPLPTKHVNATELRWLRFWREAV